MKIYQPLRQSLKARAGVELAEVLAARNDLLVIEKTNVDRRRTATHINKIIMGEVGLLSLSLITVAMSAVRQPKWKWLEYVKNNSS